MVSREHHMTKFPKPTKRTSTALIKTTTVTNHSFIKLGKSLKNAEAQLKQVKAPVSLNLLKLMAVMRAASHYCLHPPMGSVAIADEQPWDWRCRHSQTDNNRLHCSRASAVDALIPRSKLWISSETKLFKKLKVQMFAENGSSAIKQKIVAKECTNAEQRLGLYQRCSNL